MWKRKLPSSTTTSGQTSDSKSFFPTTSFGRDNKAIRMSKARAPSSTGLPSRSEAFRQRPHGKGRTRGPSLVCVTGEVMAPSFGSPTDPKMHFNSMVCRAPPAAVATANNCLTTHNGCFGRSGRKCAVTDELSFTPVGLEPTHSVLDRPLTNRRLAMRSARLSEIINQNRRRLLTTATMGIAVAGVAGLLPRQPRPSQPGRRRIAWRCHPPLPLQCTGGATRRSPPPHRGDALARPGNSQRRIARACSSRPSRSSRGIGRPDYDWRKVEARLNALPQFITEIDGARYSFHPCSFEARKCLADDCHAWLARLDHRAAEDHRPADQSHGAWRERSGRLPSRDPVAAGLRLLRQADGARMESRSHRACLGDADASASATRATWRRAATGATPSRRSWPCRQPPGLLGIHTNMPATVPADISKALAFGESAAGRSHGRGAQRVGPARLLLQEGPRLRHRDEQPSADALRHRRIRRSGLRPGCSTTTCAARR